MNTKSKIQILAEQADIKYRTLESFLDLMEKYNMNGVVLNSNSYQVTSGYFSKDHVFDTVQEAVQNMGKDDVILFEDNKFIVGKYYKSIIDTPENTKIFEIKI